MAMATSMEASRAFLPWFDEIQAADTYEKLRTLTCGFMEADDIIDSVSFVEGRQVTIQSICGPAEVVFRTGCERGKAYQCAQLVWVLTQLGRPGEGILPYQHATCTAGTTVTCLTLALYLEMSDRPSEAEAVYRIDCDGGNDDACDGLGDLQRRLARPADAEESYRRSCDHGNNAGCIGLGIVLSEDLGRTEEAEAPERQACDRGDMVACRNLSITLDRLGRREQAVDAVRIACDGGLADGCETLGTLLWKMGRRAEAEAVHSAPCENGDARACNSWGSLLYEGGYFAEAARAYRKACDLDNADGCAVAAWALLLSNGSPSEAETLGRRALNLSPDSQLALINLGDSLVMAGKVQEAFCYYARVITADQSARSVVLEDLDRLRELAGRAPASSIVEARRLVEQSNESLEASFIQECFEDGSAGTCTGGRLDPETNLCWQDPPSPDKLSWNAAAVYCQALSLARQGGDSWRMPTIDELRLLMRGCAASSTGGACGVTDACSTYDCWSTSCRGCTSGGGAGLRGAYWPAWFGDPYDGQNFVWSSSYSDESSAWLVNFNSGFISDVPRSGEAYVRCVRSGP